MIDRSFVWTGDINEAVAATTEGRRIGLYDTTLRDGEQTVGVALNATMKLEIAQALDHLGVDRIEAGFPSVSQEDVRAFELILEAGLRAEVWGFARAVPADVELLVRIGVKAAVIEAPVSDQKLRAFGIDRKKIIERIIRAVEIAQGHGLRVCFFGVDGTRADRRFLEQVYRAAVDAGAEEIAVVDTLGIATPEAVDELIRNTREWVGTEVPIHWHGHNDFGLATAGAIAAVRAGASWVQGTINGMGERAGNADLAELALALEALYGCETGLRFDLIVEASQMVQGLSGYELAPWKPVTGRNLFIRESGAVTAQFHDPPAIEPFSCQLTQAVRGVVLGKKSGLASIKIKAEELDIHIAEELYDDVLTRVKKLGSEKAGLVTDGEFRQVIIEVLARSDEPNGGDRPH